MSVLEVRIRNLKALKGDHVIKPKGNSFVIVGDSGEGKSTLLQILSAHMLQEDYPSAPLTKGETEGYTETVHEIEGVKYTITRSYKLDRDVVKLSRFSVVSEKGAKFSLTDFLQRNLIGGLNKSKFEYAKYFFECKSPEARLRYMIDSIGGEAVYENNKKIQNIESERAVVGTQRKAQQIIWEQEGIFSAETAERDILYYEKERTPDEAVKIKDAALLKRKSVTELTEKYNRIKKENENHVQMETDRDNIKSEIQELELKLKEKKALLDTLEKDLSKSTNRVAEETAAAKELETIEEDNKKIEDEANSQYNKTMSENSLFNAKRTNFINTIKTFRLWEQLDAEWNKLDEDIKTIRQENREIFKSKLPIPELSIGEVGGKETILYNDREFSFDNMSKGESVKITAQIQRVLNPNGDNFIIIPEAQSMGSQLDEIMKECEAFGVQACVEYTERNEEFKMVVAEDFLKGINDK